MRNQSTFMPIKFHCKETINEQVQIWNGTVTCLINYGSHYEISIDSRSGFFFLVGYCGNGSFISIPDFNIGSSLSDYNDYFWNNERLSSIMNPVDAATVAEALRCLKTQKYI
jgi:hypothetical protein